MSFNDEIYEQLKCCLGYHFLENAVTLPCLHNACYKCVNEKCGRILECQCSKRHRIYNTEHLPKNDVLNIFMKLNQENLIENLKHKIQKFSEKIQSSNLVDELKNDVIKPVDMKIQERVSSLKEQIDSIVLTMKEKLRLEKLDNVPMINEIIANKRPGDIARKIKEDLESGKTDYLSFQKNMNDFKRAQKGIKPISLNFNADKRKIKDTSVVEFLGIKDQSNDEKKNGEISEKSTDEEIHFGESVEAKSFAFENACFSRFVYIDIAEKKFFFICDSAQKKLLKMDSETFEVLANENPSNKLHIPVSICYNGNDKIYVGDYFRKVIFIFDLDLNFLSEFSLKYGMMPFDIDYDVYENHLYVSGRTMSKILVWDANSTTFIKDINVNTPSQIKVLKDKFIVLGGIVFSFVGKSTKKIDKIESGKNTITIFDKRDGKELKSIKIGGWFDLRGLYVDNNENIYTTAVEFDKASMSIKSNLSLLFKIDASGNLIKKQELGISNVRSIMFINKKLLVLRGKIKPQFYVIEFK